jgi:hypothetical protein
MSATPSQTLSPPEGTGTRIRNALIGAFFVLVLLIPKLLHLRRNPRSWLFFRILLALAGASLILLPVGLGNSYVLSLVGLAMFTASILLPSAKPDTSADEKARELGALVVVNGGKFKLGETPSFAAQLFVGADYVRVLDSQLRCFLEIPVSEITAARAEESHGRWFLRVNWAHKTAVFAYRGVFAEHLARVAETTLQGVMRPALPVIPQARAAGA